MPLAVRLSAPMPIVSCDVRLADADSFETVVGTFSVDGSTFAVVGEGKVELVSMENDRLGTAWADGDRAQEARSEGDPGTGPIAADDLDCLVLPTSITHAGASYELTSLGPRAFDGCDAAVVRIPASVSTVDPTAFAPLALERVEVDPANPSFASFDGVLYGADLACLLSIPGGRKGAVRMPSTTEEVDPSAFSHCAGVDAISVDAGGSAYASWDGLLYDISGETLLRVPPGAVDISIHEGCDAIAADALEGCESLATVSVLGDLDAVTPAATSCGGQAGGEGPATKKRSASVSLAAEDDELLLRQFGFESFHAASQAQHASGQASDQLPSAALSDAAAYGACTVNVKGNGGYIVEIDAGFNEVGEHYASRSISDVGYWSVFIEGAMVHYGPNASGGNTYLQAKRPGYALVAWDGLDFSGQNAVLGAYSITVTAIWEPIQISLAFDPNGGRFTDGTTNVHQWSLTYAEDKKVKDLWWGEPYWPGYTFQGWFLEDGSQVKADTPLPTSSHAVTARWKANTIRLHYDARGGKFSNGQPGPITFECAYADGKTVADCWWQSVGRTGYEFLGWFSTSGTGVERQIQGTDPLPTGNMDLYAKWKPVIYSITYDGLRGNDPGNPSSYTVESPTIVIKNPSDYLDWAFDGWSVSGSTGLSKSVTIPQGSTGDRKLTAHWTTNRGTLAIDPNGGQLKVVDAEGALVRDPSADELLVAWVGHWVAFAVGHVHYFLENGDLNNAQVERPGFTFAGWQGVDLGGEESFAGTTSASLAAQWRANSILLRFDPRGGWFSNGATAPQGFRCDYSEEKTVRDCWYQPAGRMGYDFLGWFTVGDDGVERLVEADTPLPTTNTDLYARWSAQDVTVHWDADGGSTVGDGTVKFDSPLSSQWAELPAPVRPGYSFGGWYGSSDLSGEPITPATVVQTPRSVTYYAQWTPRSYRLTLDAGEGAHTTDSVRSQGVTYDAAVGSLPGVTPGTGWRPYRYGYAFTGYYAVETAADGQLTLGARYFDADGIYVKPGADGKWDEAADRTLRAGWSLITDVTFPVEPLSGITFEVGVPDGAVRAAGSAVAPDGRAQGAVVSQMPVEVAVVAVRCEIAPEPAAPSSAEAFWSAHAGYVDMTVARDAAPDALVTTSLLAPATGPVLAPFRIPAATGPNDPNARLDLLYGMRLDRLFGTGPGEAGVDIMGLLPQGSSASFGVPTRVLDLVLTIEVPEGA